ncbi:MAG: molecular chaperone TorD family protein [Deltaproteobacteria bacterium]|nr:molecular chaperone TorD family protein [Deltaproteobacteria bacterium]
MLMQPELLEHELHRSRVYRILADAFRPPAPELENALIRLGDHLTMLESEACNTAAGLPEAFTSAGGMEPLKVDYSRLFVGPFLLPAPPYGSVYLESRRRIMGDSTMDVLEHYREMGMAMAETFKDAPDHVSAELEFMHALVCRQAEALRTEDGDGLLDSLHRQHSFLRYHLGAWIPDFTAKVMEHAETRFYRLLGEITKRFIEEEKDALGTQVVERTTHAAF